MGKSQPDSAALAPFQEFVTIFKASGKEARLALLRSSIFYGSMPHHNLPRTLWPETTNVLLTLYNDHLELRPAITVQIGRVANLWDGQMPGDDIAKESLRRLVDFFSVKRADETTNNRDQRNAATFLAKILDIREVWTGRWSPWVVYRGLIANDGCRAIAKHGLLEAIPDLAWDCHVNQLQWPYWERLPRILSQPYHSLVHRDGRENELRQLLAEGQEQILADIQTMRKTCAEVISNAAYDSRLDEYLSSMPSEIVLLSMLSIVESLLDSALRFPR